YYVNSLERGELIHGFVIVRDTPNGEWSYTFGRGSNYRSLTRLRWVRLGAYEQARTLQWTSALARLSSIQESVAAANAVVEEQNERIYQVLRETTGQRLHGAPQAWWKWWEEHNELFVADRNRRRM